EYVPLATLVDCSYDRNLLLFKISELNPDECSVKIIGVSGWCCRINVTASYIIESNCPSFRPSINPRFGKQSKMITFAGVLAIKSKTGFSKRPFPENPKLTVGIFKLRFNIFVQASPGLDAHAPCAMEVP